MCYSILSPLIFICYHIFLFFFFVFSPKTSKTILSSLLRYDFISYYSSTFHSITFLVIPFLYSCCHAIPFHSIPFHSIPIHSMRLDGIQCSSLWSQYHKIHYYLLIAICLHDNPNNLWLIHY